MLGNARSPRKLHFCVTRIRHTGAYRRAHLSSFRPHGTNKYGEEAGGLLNLLAYFLGYYYQAEPAEPKTPVVAPFRLLRRLPS